MGFKSKKSASQTGNSGGRPPSDYSSMSDSEKAEYHRQAMEKHRHPGRKEVMGNDKDKRSERCESGERSIGRPPIGLIAMSPNKLRVRMNF